MKKICLIGQFPPPIHGLSKALETVRLSEYLNKRFLLSHINITDNKKILSHLNKIRKSDSDIYYFTIAHSKLGNIRDLIILCALVRKKKKIIIHYHGGYYRKLYNKMNFLQKKLNNILISKVDTIIVLSKSLRSLFSGMVPQEKIKICENFVEDSSLLSDKEFDCKINNLVNKKKIDILYLSNFIKSKGYIDVLDVARKFKGKEVNFHFAGKFFSNKEFNEFKSFIDSNGLDNVQFHGVVNGNQKKKLFNNCDVFILPTYYHIEGQPISIIEALANGLTVITTNHAGIPDIISTDNGYIIEPKQTDQIENAIYDLIFNREKIIEYAKVNREYALRNFKEIDYIKRLEKIFIEV